MSAKGEKYKSMAAMKKHEKSEPMSARVKEYGKKATKSGMHMMDGKMMKNSAMKKTAKKAAKKSSMVRKRGM